MKKLFTLAAAGVLVAASLGAQAQVTVNGVLNTVETNAPATTGDYVLLGQYPYAHGFGPWGLLSMYAGNTSSKVFVFLGGTLQPPATNSLQLFMDLGGSTGIPTGIALPGATQMPSTSLDNFKGKLDQPVRLAVALHSLNPTTPGTAFQIEAAVYTTTGSGTTATYAAKDTVIAPITATGTVVTVGRIGTKSVFSGLSGARFSYVGSTGTNDITNNPGYTAPLTTTVTSYPVTGFGQANNTTGWEMEMDRTALGLPTGNPTIRLFSLHNNGGGDYASSDFIPNAVVGGTNLGAGGQPDFTSSAFPGTQSATLALATVLGTKAADAAAIGLSVYPNPSRDKATVAYQVADRAATVSIALTDLLGRTVRSVEAGTKQVGSQTTELSTANLAAGTYLVRVQVGERVSTSKIAVL